MASEPRSTIGIQALFGVVYATSISSVYFALGVVAHHANGLTPAVFVVAGVFFLLTAMTYAEGASIHPESGGSAVFARYAFNELVSFLSGWAIVLDYTILVAVAALTAPVYLGVFWPALDHGVGQVLAAVLVIGLIAADTVRGTSGRRLRRRALVTVLDLSLQVAVIVLGAVLVFDPSHLTQTVHLGTAPSAADLGYALPIGVIAFAGIESAANLAGETAATPSQLKRLVGVGGALIVTVYVGIAVVGIGTVPVHDGVTALGQQHVNAPMLGIVESYRPVWVADVLKYVVGVLGRRRADVGRGGGDAGRLARRLLACDQPADPECNRASQRSLGNAVVGDRWRRGRRRRARDPDQPGTAGGHLRVRRADRVRGRAPVGDRDAVPRSRPRAELRDAVLGAAGRGQTAAARGCRRDARRRGTGSPSSSFTTALDTSGLAGCWPASRCT